MQLTENELPKEGKKMAKTKTERQHNISVFSWHYEFIFLIQLLYEYIWLYRRGMHTVNDELLTSAPEYGFFLKC